MDRRKFVTSVAAVPMSIWFGEDPVNDGVECEFLPREMVSVIVPGTTTVRVMPGDVVRLMYNDDKKLYVLRHWSDCAVNDAPAYSPGPCNCAGLWEEVVLRGGRV